MDNKEIMSICKSCGHEILWRYNHWEHRKSHKQGIKENSRLPKPDILSNCCVECDEVGNKCCNPEPRSRINNLTELAKETKLKDVDQGKKAKTEGN